MNKLIPLTLIATLAVAGSVFASNCTKKTEAATTMARMDQAFQSGLETIAVMDQLLDQRLLDLDAARRVRRLVAVLPGKHREVVMRRIFEELSVADTAQAMGCRQGTVKALLHKAVRRLRENGMEGLGE